MTDWITPDELYRFDKDHLIVEVLKYTDEDKGRKIRLTKALEDKILAKITKYDIAARKIFETEPSVKILTVSVLRRRVKIDLPIGLYIAIPYDSIKPVKILLSRMDPKDSISKIIKDKVLTTIDDFVKFMMS